MRRLQSGGSDSIQGAINLIKTGDSISFETSAAHFPVYVSASLYNSNPDFDDGVFDTLKTKILNAGLDITSFAYTFTQEGVFVFGDYSNPTGL
jgi:hypothetical protein